MASITIHFDLGKDQWNRVASTLILSLLENENAQQLISLHPNYEPNADAFNMPPIHGESIIDESDARDHTIRLIRKS